MKKAYNLIILPGWGGTKKTWESFSSLVEKDFSSVKVIELPCFGNEPCPKDVWGVEEYARFVQEKIKAIQSEKKEPIILLGHSFGGQVAAYLSATNPTICDTLILSGAAIYRPRNVLKRVIFWPIAKLGKAFLSLPGIKKLKPYAQSILYKVADSPDYLHTEKNKKAIFQKVIRQDISHVLKDIELPTTIVWGKKDRYTPVRYAYRIHKAISSSRLYIIPEGTHGLHISSPHILRSHILESLS